MDIIVSPGSIAGTVMAPPSKSHSQRLLAAALLYEGETAIRNFGYSEDEQAVLQLIQDAGAIVEERGRGQIDIRGAGKKLTGGIWHCGESGLAARLFLWLAATQDDPITLLAKGSLLKRPVTGFREPALQCNVSLKDFTGYLPCTVQGPWIPRDLAIDASAGSQLLSGLLYALAWFAREPVKLTVSELRSKPYIDLTMDVLRAYGCDIRQDSYRYFYLQPFQPPIKEYQFQVEGDWSNAACLIVAGALAGEVTVSGLKMNSLQADRAILEVCSACHADYIVHGDAVTVRPSPKKAFTFDATDCPDLFPILAVLAAGCSGISRIRGLHRLADKESNREHTVMSLLDAFGIRCKKEKDELCVEGTSRPFRPAVIPPYGDHRLVMAASVAALSASAPVHIKGAQAVQKSWPGFFHTMKTLGQEIHIME